jgi:hypothetical protein
MTVNELLVIERAAGLSMKVKAIRLRIEGAAAKQSNKHNTPERRAELNAPRLKVIVKRKSKQ